MKCLSCGEEDETKFYKTRGSKCKRCIIQEVTDRKERVNRTELYSYKCVECGEEDVTKFHVTTKTICKRCNKLQATEKRKKTMGELNPCKCTECGEDDETKFYYYNKSKCKVCHSAINRDRYKNLTDEKKQEYMDKIVERNNSNIFKVRCDGGKSRANKKGLAWEMNETILTRMLEEQNGLCYYSGLPMTLSGDDANYSVSIERKDSSIGYVEGNVVLCCSAVNRMKNKLSTDTFFEFITAIFTNQNSG